MTNEGLDIDCLKSSLPLTQGLATFWKPLAQNVLSLASCAS